MVDALKGVEVLVLALGFTAVGQYQVGIIEAAIEAGVQWILPTEYGGDNENPSIRKVVAPLSNFFYSFVFPCHDEPRFSTLIPRNTDFGSMT